MKELLRIGLPMGLQYSITGIGSIILQSSVNTLGSMIVAAVTAGSKIHQIFNTFFGALGSAVASYTGQNAGNGQTKRIKSGLASSMI